jgi:spore germination protein GerM
MSKKILWVSLIILFFIAGVAGSYFFLYHFFRPEKEIQVSQGQGPVIESGDLSVLRIYQPRNGRLEMTERKIPKRISSMAIAEAVVEEFFKHPVAEGASTIPLNVKLLGLYKDEAQMLYVDLSDEVRRNFQGDALSEYLLLDGLYESLVSNVPDFQDVKILVEGQELETLGGHLYLKYPLKNVFSTELKGDVRIEDE